MRQTSAAYSLTGKPVTSTDANGNVTRYAYDTDDRLSSVSDPLGRVTGIAYDALSRKIAVSNLAIQSMPLLQQAYTPDGLVASLTNANGYATSFTPDGFDRLATTTYPDASTQVLAYDADSNVLTRQTRAAQTISFTYDTLNRLSTKAAPSEASVTYGYDLFKVPLWNFEIAGAPTLLYLTAFLHSIVFIGKPDLSAALDQQSVGLHYRRASRTRLRSPSSAKVRGFCLDFGGVRKRNRAALMNVAG